MLDHNEQLALLLKGLLDATPDLIFAKGPDYRYIIHNDAFSQLVGRPGANLAGLRDEDIFTDLDAVRRLRRSDEIILQSGQSVHLQEEATYPDGRRVLLDTLKTPFYDSEGSLVGLLGISRDVSKRVAAERAAVAEKENALQASQAKSEFLAKMSHEIRTPMNAVIGLSKLLARTPLAKEQRDFVAKIDSSADALLNIINDILDYSKIEAQRLTLENVRFNLQTVVDRAITICELKALDKGIELIVHMPSSVPQQLIGDPHRLQQILVNLISNAVKFTERGHVLITVSSGELKVDRLSLHFSISDTGIGIAEQDRKLLFSSFSQVDNSLTRPFEGTGLGLAITRQLVELMGGGITVESQPGLGSTFTFDVRCTLQRETAEPARSPEYRRLKVLVVDDNAIARGIVGEMLSDLGIVAEFAGSGSEAIDRASREAQERGGFDLILMDWKMPGLDGISAATQLKREHGMAHIPAVLLLSAYDLDEARRLCPASVVDAYLEKPVRLSALRDAISEALPGFDATLPAPHSVSDVAPAGPLDLRGRRILVVDDNEINRTVVLGYLEPTGLTIDIARDGQEALEKVAATGYDLILMDIQMPRMDGITATGILRAQAQYRSLPIVAMTANAMAGDKSQCLKAGMDGYIVKPIEPSELLRMLARWLLPGTGSPLVAEDSGSCRTSALLARLQAIDGIDMRPALMRCQGREALYASLVRSFVGDNANVGAEIATLQQSGSSEALFIRLHSLKSAAAYIGAQSLSDAAAELEMKARDKNIAAADLNRLSSRADALVKRLKGALAEGAAGPPGTERLELELPGVLRQLEPLLAASDFQAEPFLAELLALCRNTHWEDVAFRIEQSVADIQFEQATEQCRQLMRAVDNSRLQEA